MIKGYPENRCGPRRYERPGRRHRTRMEVAVPYQPIPHRRPEKTRHPGIYRKGNRYIDQWKDNGRTRSKSYTTITAAVRGQAERKALGLNPSRERFDRYAHRWLDTTRGRTKRGLGVSTRADYRKITETWLIPRFRHKPVGDIGPRDVREFVDHLCQQTNRSGQPLAAATIRWIMTPLKAMLSEAYERQLTALDASHVKIVIPDRTQGKRRPRTINAEQTTTILEALPAGYRPLFSLLAYTGLRISEALGLQWQDLEQTSDGLVLNVRRQFYRGQLVDHAKTHAGERQVALVPELARELMRHRAATQYPAAGDPVFTTMYGTHLSAHNIRRMLRPVTEALGLEWVTPHVFRHSLATALADHGYHANQIARVLGHTDPGFTQRTYIHAPNVVRFDDVFTRAEDIPEDIPDTETGGIS